MPTPQEMLDAKLEQRKLEQRRAEEQGAYAAGLRGGRPIPIPAEGGWHNGQRPLVHGTPALERLHEIMAAEGAPPAAEAIAFVVNTGLLETHAERRFSQLLPEQVDALVDAAVAFGVRAGANVKSWMNKVYFLEIL